MVLEMGPTGFHKKVKTGEELNSPNVQMVGNPEHPEQGPEMGPRLEKREGAITRTWIETLRRH